MTSDFIHLRYCPAALFILEGISKTTMVLFIYVKIYDYINEHHNHTHESLTKFSSLEISIVLLLALQTLYEYGKMIGNTCSLFPSIERIKSHFSSIWGILDISGLICLHVWQVSRFNDIEPYGRAAMSISAIFLSCSLLRFISLDESIGKLVIMVVAMINTLKSFFWVFLFCVSGFALALQGLFPEVHSFSNEGDSLMNLFSMTLHIYEGFTYHEFNESREFALLGKLIQVVFIVFSSVVLVHLIIARMSSTYESLEEKSFQAWQLAKAMTVDQFLLVEERHPFCMLPAPFNLLPVIFSPFHMMYLKLNLNEEHHSITSISGTVADFSIGVVMSFICPFIEVGLYVLKV
jgi:hypothetical protein